MSDYVRTYNRVFAEKFQKDYPSAILHDIATPDPYITVNAEEFMYASREPQYWMPQNLRPGQTGPGWMGITIRGEV